MTSPSEHAATYAFAFRPSYRAAALVFGITPRTARVTLGPGGLGVRFGLWRLHSPITNIVAAETSGGFAWVKTAGPPHLSFSDRGVSFATNGDDGVCVSFREPVRGIDPTGRITHPGATLTLADNPGFLRQLAALRDG